MERSHLCISICAFAGQLCIDALASFGKLATDAGLVRAYFSRGCLFGIGIGNGQRARTLVCSGKSVGMNPFALLIAIMFWTWAWGPIGLLMATPLSLILATLGRHLPYLKSVDFLLSDERPLAAHLVYFQRLLANDISEAEALLNSIQLKRGLPFVVDMVAIRSMAHSDRELKAKKVTSELHNLVWTTK